jgi:hypothetical protein
MEWEKIVENRGGEQKKMKEICEEKSQEHAFVDQKHTTKRKVSSCLPAAFWHRGEASVMYVVSGYGWNGWMLSQGWYIPIECDETLII